MRSIFFTFITSCLSIFAVNVSAQTAKISNAQVGLIDSLVNNAMAGSGMAGVGVAILIDRQPVYIKGFGYADVANKIPFTVNTAMNIASISKTFTGVCLMRAVEEGKLSLDEDVSKYLPFKIINPYFPEARITLRQLANHTSGITDREPVYDSTYFYGGDAPVKLEDFLKDYFVPGRKFYSKENYLNHRPGTYREYCNIASALAGYIVERVTGKPLNVYSREIIFKPLKMENTGWLLAEMDLAKHTKLYDRKTGTLKMIPLYGLTTYPDGGVRTSVSQLAKFFAMLLNDGIYNGTRILRSETAKELTRLQFTREHHPENVDPGKLNSGIFWATKNNGTLIGHGGTDPGLKTEMLANLNRSVGIVLFTNTELSDEYLAKYYFGLLKQLFLAVER